MVARSLGFVVVVGVNTAARCQFLGFEWGRGWANAPTVWGKSPVLERDVPESDFTLVVQFEATGKPEEPEDCPESEDSGLGAEVEGRVYGLIEIPEYECPEPEFVEVLWVNNEPAFGFCRWDPAVQPVLYCEQICAPPCRPAWRVEGWAPNLVKEILIARALPVTSTNCPGYEPGSTRPRSEENIARTIAHEIKHCAIILEFVNGFNCAIRIGRVFYSEQECAEWRKVLLEEWDRGIADLKRRGKSHCPDFAGEPVYYITDCGEERFRRIRRCE